MFVSSNQQIFGGNQVEKHWLKHLKISVFERILMKF
jgi:hypothetical protein